MVAALFLSHLVGDYILQWDSLARWKARELNGVLAHGAVVQATTLLFTLPFNPDWWPWALFVGVTHTLIDTVPLSIGKHVHPCLWFVLDQAAHFVIMVIALTASGYLGASTLVSDLILALTSNRVWAFTLGYTFLTMPAWVTDLDWSAFPTPETAPWSLKGWAPILNWISVAWIIFITILFSIPPNELAGWSMIILVVFMILYWQLDAKKRFTGPKPTAEVELRKIEAEMTQGDD